MKTMLHKGKHLALVQEGHWEYAERTNATGAAIIAALTPEGKLLLVEQYRVPVHARTIEFPAGIIGDEPGDENDAASAKRELLEETGYEAAEMEAVATGPASSGLTSEVITIFIARKLRRVHAGGGIGNEKIIVHEVDLAQIDQWLDARVREGFLIEPKVYAGLYFLNKNR
jgi:ADP-ribose pyrophosphatase